MLVQVLIGSEKFMTQLMEKDIKESFPQDLQRKCRQVSIGRELAKGKSDYKGVET